MTAFMRAFVFCNGPGCGVPMDDSTVPDAETIAEARKQARRSGWHYAQKTSHDLCADCWANGNR